MKTSFQNQNRLTYFDGVATAGIGIWSKSDYRIRSDAFVDSRLDGKFTHFELVVRNQELLQIRNSHLRLRGATTGLVEFLRSTMELHGETRRLLGARLRIRFENDL